MSVILVDVGGTHIRFSIYLNGEMSEVVQWRISEFDDFSSAVRQFLSDKKDTFSGMIIGAAGIRTANCIQLTNYTWLIDAEKIKSDFQLQFVTLVNDFSLQGLGLLVCKEAYHKHLGAYIKPQQGTCAVVGSGTGLGVCFLVQNDDGSFQVVESEAGHTTISGVTPALSAIAHKAFEKLPHISFERFVSGPGVLFLYQIIGENYAQWQETVLFDEVVAMKQAYQFNHTLDETFVPVNNPLEITRLAEQGNEIALITWWLFFQYLGVFCSNMALAFKTTGGVYLVGSIFTHPFVRKLLEQSAIRKIFETKGRFKKFMRSVPLVLVTKERIQFDGLVYLAQKAKNN